MSDLIVRPLAVVQQERAAFGLRSHDYARYRKHCASKLHRLRQNLHVTHGKGREFKKVPPTPVEKAQDGHILIHLFEAERAYSHAQELLNSPDGSEKHHALARFRRSVHHSSSLLAFLPRLSAISQAEVAAYHLILQARYAIAKRDDGMYNPALVQLATARAVLAALAEAAGTSRDVALYTSFQDTISPLVRFLAHELGHPRAWDTAAVCADVKPAESEAAWKGYGELLRKLGEEKKNKGQGELKPLIWEGKELQVREPELVELLIKVQSAQEALTSHASQPASAAEESAAEVPKAGKGKGKGRKKHRLLPAYDALLLALADAEDLARRLSEAAQLGQAQGLAPLSSGAAGAAGGKESDIGFLHAFVTYRLLATRIERDLLLVKMLENPPKAFGRKSQAPAKPSTSTSTSKDKGKDQTNKGKEKQNEQEQEEKGPDERTSLAIIKSLDSVVQSLEQMRELAVVQESLVVGEGLEGRVNYTRAKRIDHLARLYSGQKQYPESLALLSRGEIYLRPVLTSSTATQSTPELAFYPLSTELAQALKERMDQLATRVKKDWFAATHKKPVFYDIAFNYVEQPMDRVRARAGLPPAEGSTLVTGAAQAAETVKGAVKGAVGKVGEVVAGEKRQQVEREEEPTEKQGQQGGQQKAGWSGYLGGWWGRK